MAPDEPKPQNQVCTITIAFPVDSDDKAIEYKKKISSIVADIPEARVEFRIMTMGKRIV